ncbi:MAG: AAA family ATPase [Phycisphaeraceae bacterium]
MSLMETLITSTTPAAPKMIVYGQPGVGKTTFAAAADAILIDCEGGAGVVPGLKRTPYLATWPEMRAWLSELAAAPPADLAAVAVDTLDWMLRRIEQYVNIDLDGKSPDDITNTTGSSHGGFFKARGIIENIVFRDLLPMLNAINDGGVPIVLLAHAANLKMTTPEGFDVKMAAPDLPQWIAGPFIEWADAVLYAHMDSGQRVLTTENTNVVTAKNRYGMPAELPFDWDTLVQSIAPPAPPTATTT